MRSIRVVLAVGLLSSCSTAYQPMGTSGGYTDEPLGNNTFLVTVRVNAHTDASTAFQYFHRRSAEVCLENGFRSYQVLDSDRSTKRSIVGFGNNRSVLVEKARVFGRIECTGVPGVPGPGEAAFDAEIVRIDTVAKRMYINVKDGSQNVPMEFDANTVVAYARRYSTITALEFGDLVRITVRQTGPETFRATRVDVLVPVQNRNE